MLKQYFVKGDNKDPTKTLLMIPQSKKNVFLLFLFLIVFSLLIHL